MSFLYTYLDTENNENKKVINKVIKFMQNSNEALKTCSFQAFEIAAENLCQLYEECFHYKINDSNQIYIIRTFIGKQFFN